MTRRSTKADQPNIQRPMGGFHARRTRSGLWAFSWGRVSHTSHLLVDCGVGGRLGVSAICIRWAGLGE